MLHHKTVIFPHVDLSNDGGDPEWDGEDFVPIEGRSAYRWVSPPGICFRAWESYKEDWESTVAGYEADEASFYRSWHYLNNHPIYWTFDQTAKVDEWPPDHLHRLLHSDGISRCVSLYVVQVNPENETIEDEEEKNTATRVWYETGKKDLLPGKCGQECCVAAQWHDIDLDGGAPTVEEAIVALAFKVWDSYGNDRRIADREK